MTENYQEYSLTDNPFPEVATFDPYSPDRRINGEIFCEDIVRDEMKELQEKIGHRVNVVYVAGLEFDKGVGKSALVAHEWRRLVHESNVTVPYVRCKSRQQPSDFCDRIVAYWTENGHIWKAFGRILLEFARAKASPSITENAVELMLKSFTEPPPSFPYARYFHVTKTDILAHTLGEWMHMRDPRIDSKFGTFLIEENLTQPRHFADGFLKLKIGGLDRIDLYKNTLLCLGLGGYAYHYLFLDQFEDAVMPVSPGRIAEFCLGLRRMIEAHQGLVTLLVTLHPDSEMKLELPGAADLVKIAPADNNHRVDVLALEKDGRDAIALTKVYLDSYRQGEAPDPTSPFSEEAIQYICYLEGGNVRRTLQRLHSCLKFAAGQNAKRVTLDYLITNHRDMMGTELQNELLSKFRSKATQDNKP